jgi:hypothetical protein
MATQNIYAGGARRGAAPVVQRQAPVGQMAQTADDVLNTLVTGMQTYAAQQQAAQPRTSSAGFDMGSGRGDGGFGTTNASAPGSLGSAARTVGTVGSMAGAVGQLGRDPGLAQFGGMLGQIGGLMNTADKLTKAQNINDVAVATAPMGMAALGVNPGVAGAVMGGLTQGVPGAIAGTVRGIAYGALPGLAAVDMALQAIGLPSIAGSLNNAVRDAKLGESLSPDSSLAAQFSIGREVATADDPLGALLGRLGIDTAMAQSMGRDDEYGFSASDLGELGSYSYNSPSMDLSNRPRFGGGGGGGFSGGGVNNSAGSGFGGGSTGQASAQA